MLKIYFQNHEPIQTLLALPGIDLVSTTNNVCLFPSYKFSKKVKQYSNGRTGIKKRKKRSDMDCVKYRKENIQGASENVFKNPPKYAVRDKNKRFPGTNNQPWRTSRIAKTY